MRYSYKKGCFDDGFMIDFFFLLRTPSAQGKEKKNFKNCLVVSSMCFFSALLGDNSYFEQYVSTGLKPAIKKDCSLKRLGFRECSFWGGVQNQFGKSPNNTFLNPAN